jgi:hypothetical protein
VPKDAVVPDGWAPEPSLATVGEATGVA